MLNATIQSRIEVSKDLVIIKVSPDGGVPDFQPGQYVALGLYGRSARPADFPAEAEHHDPDKLIKRAYSIGSSPLDKSGVEFYIAIAAQGALTSRLALLRCGERLYMAPKITGTFTVNEVPASHNLIFVATGTGIAPYMAMLRTPSCWHEERKITLLHGVRYVEDLAYRDELLALSQRDGRFSYHAIVSRADASWQGQRGYVQKFFKENLITLDSAVDHVFICGNPAMIDEATALLSTRGYTEHLKRHPGNLHLEKYW